MPRRIHAHIMTSLKNHCDEYHALLAEREASENDEDTDDETGHRDTQDIDEDTDDLMQVITDIACELFHQDDTEETITCDLCGKCEIEHDAIESGWIPSYWNSQTPVDNPVCDKCSKERIREIEGDYVLIEPEPENERRLDAAVRAVVNGQ